MRIMKLGMRIIIIALLVLSGAALAMGIVLFQQREMLKGRTQKLETAIKQVAATLEAGDASDVKLVIQDNQLKTYKQKPGGPPAMDIPLNQVTLAAQNQLGRLNGTRSVLAETRATLAKTEDELKITQTNLAVAKADKAEIVSLNETVVARNTTIAERDGSIKTLEQEKSELTAKAEEQSTKITGLESEKTQLTEEVATLEDENKKLKMAKATEPGSKPQLTKGQHGKVLYVDPEWNFLIIGLASEESQKNVGPDLEFIIHRANKLVGKVRVKAIEDNMAIADIMTDWLQVLPQKGDYVIY